MRSQRLLQIRRFSCASHLSNHEIVLGALVRVRAENEPVHGVVLVRRVALVRHPLQAQRGPLQRMREHEVIEERGVLLPDLVLRAARDKASVGSQESAGRGSEPFSRRPLALNSRSQVPSRALLRPPPAPLHEPLRMDLSSPERGSEATGVCPRHGRAQLHLLVDILLERGRLLVLGAHLRARGAPGVFADAPRAGVLPAPKWCRGRGSISK